MLIFGCKTPGLENVSDAIVWNCPENMQQKSKGYEIAPACAEGSVIYAWAQDAPALRLPPGVAYRIGGDSGINFLVLQAHYIKVDAFRKGATDDSGIILTMLPGSSDQITKSAGIMLVKTEGRIPAHSIEHLEGSCRLSELLVLHPFAFRTHTHHLGTAVTGWKVSHDKKWSLIGRKNPQLPQSFYPVANQNLSISEGEIVATRCVMVNDQDHEVKVG